MFCVKSHVPRKMACAVYNSRRQGIHGLPMCYLYRFLIDRREAADYAFRLRSKSFGGQFSSLFGITD